MFKPNISICLLLNLNAQENYTYHDTLFNRYAISYQDMGWKGVSHDEVKLPYKQRYFNTHDIIIEGNYFLVFGVCISSKEEPFYFIKTSFASILNNPFFEYTKPITMRLRFGSINSETKEV